MRSKPSVAPHSGWSTLDCAPTLSNEGLTEASCESVKEHETAVEFRGPSAPHWPNLAAVRFKLEE